MTFDSSLKFFQFICNSNSTKRVACMDTMNLYREVMYKGFYYISLIKAGLYSPFRRSSFLHVKINYIRNVTVNVGQSYFVKGSFLPIKNNRLSLMNLRICLLYRRFTSHQNILVTSTEKLLNEQIGFDCSSVCMETRLCQK